MSFFVKFRGVRGSFPVCLSTHYKFGGHTSCVEIHCGDDIVLLDAGTGIVSAGYSLVEQQKKFNILLSHVHWDHIQGFPFFLPAYKDCVHITVMASHLKELGGLEKVFSMQMTEPYFPVPISSLRAQKEFQDFTCGDSFTLHDEIKITTNALNHPNKATGYRIEYEGHAVAYITDTEHNSKELDQNVLALIEGCDLVIYDSMYTDENFKHHIGWGHSTWQEAIRLCDMANAKSVALFHHDPVNDDKKLDIIDSVARKAWSGAFVAREDMTIEINGNS